MELFKSFEVILGLVLCIVLNFDNVNGCRISSGWSSLKMNERLLSSDIIVYGKTTQHVANVRRINDRTFTFIDAVFEVYCVMKKDEDPVKEEILIQRISPRDGCSGTRKNMQTQQEAIVALTRTTDGHYQYHEVIPTLSASFTPSRAAFYSIAGTCDLQNWAPPSNSSQNRCPICGIADFTDDAMEADQSATAPCTIDASFISENEECEMYIPQSYSNTSLCLPTGYTNTCIRLSYNPPTATCVCDDVKHFQNNMIDVGEGSIIKPSVIATICSVLFTVLSVFV